MASIARRADGSEILYYNEPEYPVRTGSSTLAIFADYAADCHWHHDFEVLIADVGEIDYYVNGQVIHLRQGEAILVNGGRLHYGFSAAYKDCHYRFAVFHPMLFGGTAPIAAALDLLTADASADWWHITADEPFALAAIDRMCSLTSAEDALLFQSAAATLLHHAIRHNENSGIADPNWAILRRMTGYIQQHYTNRILLADIATAGSVCRSRCCAIFREKLHTTPNAYLTRYRLGRASGMIRTGCSITEAALSSGFQSASYFSEAFARHYGDSPRKLLRPRTP